MKRKKRTDVVLYDGNGAMRRRRAKWQSLKNGCKIKGRFESVVVTGR
jgi:hypothetical protein